MNRPEVVTPRLLRAWPLSDPGSGKEARGRLVVLAGGRTTPGAALLAAEAGLRVGAGKLAVATAASAAVALAVALPEALVLDLPEDAEGAVTAAATDRLIALAEGADALLVGPGFEDPDKSVALLDAIVPRLSCPLVVDALATAYLTERADGVAHLDGRVVVNANPVELACIVGAEELRTAEEILDAAREVARTRRAVVLAGADAKHIVTPDGSAWLVEGGGVGLGVSGSGDVQAGIVAGLLARGAEPAQAAVWAAYLHARAGERLAGHVGRLGYLARELPPTIPTVLNELA